METSFKYNGKDVHFLNLDPEDHIEGYLARGILYEEVVLKFIEDLHVEGIYLDAGAYIGNHSIFFSLFCPATYIYAFEPQASAYTKLINNIHANGISNCVALNAALSDSTGLGKFASAVEGNGGMATLTEDESVSTVGIYTVDSFMRGTKLMKLDVEGMELNVLRGAEKNLKTVEHLFVEIPPNPEKKDAIVQFLFPRNLHLTNVFADEQIYYFRKCA